MSGFLKLLHAFIKVSVFLRNYFMCFLENNKGVVCALRNIVSTVNLDCKLDLKAIALQARNAEYNPKACAFVWQVQ